MIGEAIGLVPFAGGALKSGINALAKQWEKQLKLKQRKTEDLELAAGSLLQGKNFATRDLEKQLVNIYNKAPEDERGGILDSIVTHGVAGTLDNIKKAEAEKARQKAIDERLAESARKTPLRNTFFGSKNKGGLSQVFNYK
jgi:hypothetical protein